MSVFPQSWLFFTHTRHRLIVGLFSVAGLAAVAFGPIIGRMIDRLVPWYAALASTLLLAVFQAIHTGAGGINIGAVIVVVLMCSDNPSKSA